MRDRYETVYGIFNHATQAAQRPLALVAMHWCEDTATDSTLYERIDLFLNRDVSKHSGLSLVEFLELPSDLCSYLLEVATKRQKLEGTVASTMLRDLEGRQT